MSDRPDASFQADAHRISGEHEIGHHRFERGEAEPRSVLPSTHRVAILTCMDARMDSAKLAGLRGTDAHVIRNAGGRATEDAIRSLVLSYQLLRTREWYVVQHSHCGMALLSEDLTRELLNGGPRRNGASLKISVPSARDGGHVHKLAVRDQEQSLVADITRIRNHPLVPAGVPIYGYIYDVETERFIEVNRASEVGASTVRELSALPQAAAR
jgi:carbonic anhydrase